MKDELQTKMVEILSSIQSTAGQAKDFALEQLPDIAQSYVMYGRALALAYLALGVAGIAFAYWKARWELMNFEQDPDIKSSKFRSTRQHFAISGCAFLGAVSALVILLNLKSGLLVWLAPKVWLLKELAGLLK